MAAAKCTGHKSNGEPCSNWPMHEQKVCHAHGGRSPQAIRAAELRLMERQARELFGKLVPTLQPVENPLAAYAELAGRVIAWMELMDSLLDELSGVGYESEYTGEQVHAAIQLYERAMDRANTVLASYARLRIDERLAEITERQKMTVVRAIEAALDEIGIPPAERAGARREVARQLRLVEPA